MVTLRIPFNVPLLVFTLLLVLKLTGVVAWSWWIITMPLWVPLALILMVLAFMMLTFVAVLTLALVVNR